MGRGRDAGEAGLIGDPPHPRPIGVEMGPGLMGHGASTSIRSNILKIFRIIFLV